MNNLQDTYSPKGICFGCGPANEKGLRIKSVPTGEAPDSDVICQWTPEKHHQAFEGMLNGGITGALLDCHSNWAAVRHLMKRDSLEKAPCTVTADFHVKLRRPTPVDRPLKIAARAVSSEGPKVTVEAELSADGEVTATCVGHFVAVKPGHPAYNRWE